MNFTANADRLQRSPANRIDRQGDATVSLDIAIKTLSCKVNYSSPLGDGTPHISAARPTPEPLLACSFRSTARVLNPAVGSKVLTDTQIAELMAGTWYINVYTKANPGSEIRGQVRPAN